MRTDSPGIYRLRLDGVQRALLDINDRMGAVGRAGAASVMKSHVFVALPSAIGMENVYYYGIQGPARIAGLICELFAADAQTPDVIDRLKSKIDSASVVVADLSIIEPMVLLSLGYAWGRAKPTILLVTDKAQLLPYLSGQTYIEYSPNQIRSLDKALSNQFIRLLS